MVWFVISLLFAVVNVVVMEAFAQSKIGATPILLPLILAIVCLYFLIDSVALVLRGFKKKSKFWMLHSLSAILWAVLIVLNMKHFVNIMYVM